MVTVGKERSRRSVHNVGQSSRIRILRFSDFKNMTFHVFQTTYQKVVKIFSKSLVLNPWKWVHILRSVITVIQFSDPRVWSILSHCWTSSGNDVRFWQQWRGTINIEQPWKSMRTFLRFFENSKKHDILRFLSCCARFLELWWCRRTVLVGGVFLRRSVRNSSSCRR